MGAAEELRSSRSFILAALQLNGRALRFASDILRGDPEVVLQAVQSDWRSLKHADRELREDRLFLQRAVHVDPLVLAFASEELRADPELVALSLQVAAAARVGSQSLANTHPRGPLPTPP